MESGIKTREELKFFGSVSASVSHEIKNVFAVINEGAGLLEDLALLAGKGVELTPERLLGAVQSIQGQIRKGDEIVKNMNAFAHSVDEDVRELDITETARLITALTGRAASMRNASIEFAPGESVWVETDPYVLERLLHGVILSILDNVEARTALGVSARSGEQGGIISINGCPAGFCPSDNNDIERLAQPLGVKVLAGKTTDCVELHLPKTMPAQDGQQ